MKKNYITSSGFKKLQLEFHELFHVERPKVVETVAWAASNGDRSENGDYIYGKRRLRQIDSRVHYLKKRLEEAEVIDPSKLKSKTIVFGASLLLSDEDGGEKQIYIVGEDEIEPERGKISWKSPLAKALLGKQEGDIAKVPLPKGEVEYEIIQLEYKEI